MPRFKIPQLVLLATVALFAGIGVSAAEPPATLDSGLEPDTLIWVRLDEAVDEKGNLRLERFTPSYRRDIAFDLKSTEPIPKELLERTEKYEELCSTIEMVMSGLPGRPHRTLEDLVANAQSIVVGEIGEVTPGFYAAHPRTLLTFRSFEVLASSYPVPESIYISYPRAAFIVAEKALCARDHQMPPTPAPGDRVLVFSFYAPRDADKAVIEPYSYGFFLQKAGGELAVPRALDKKPLFHYNDLPAIEEVVRRIVAKELKESREED